MFNSTKGGVCPVRLPWIWLASNWYQNLDVQPACTAVIYTNTDKILICRMRKVNLIFATSSTFNSLHIKIADKRMIQKIILLAVGLWN